ncbi:MAG: hypothetical protein ABSA59_24605 [Terriglobia bacterium]
MLSQITATHYPWGLEWPAWIFTDGMKEHMEFHLLYSGRLKAAGGLDDKFAIRRQMNPQLAQLWETHPAMLRMKNEGFTVFGEDFANLGVHPANVFGDTAYLTLDQFAEQFRIGDFRFAPLICRSFLTTCSLDILFLRCSPPGKLIYESGDIDNRIKTLFDGLRMPKPGQEIGGQKPAGQAENPFFCLLEDDSLITDFRVTGDRLLTPATSPDHSENEVHLVIKVKVNVPHPIPLNMPFL